MSTNPEENLLLASLQPKDLRRFFREAETVSFLADEFLCEIGKPIEHVYFPGKGCLVSVVKILGDGKRFDVAAVGYEGMVGAEAFLGARAGLFESIVRVGGSAVRMKVEPFVTQVRRSSDFSQILQRYLQFLFLTITEKATCHRFHSLEKHFCTRLLLLQDRTQAEEFNLTHAIFAQMLGVRRVGISQAARKLQRTGAIRYGWGKLTIIDRKKLEGIACACYRQLTQGYQRLLEKDWPQANGNG